jgi:site-specific DNA-methyltransferase (adenine-specific)
MTESVLDPWLMLGDTLERMKEIPDGSVDMVMADLPYGTTQNKWNSVIPLEPLWKEYWRLLKSNGTVVLTAQTMFTASLMVSSPNEHRYNLIWEKTKAGGFLNARRMPLQAHEDIVVFYKSLPTYNPQMEPGKPYTKKAVSNGDGKNYGKFDRQGKTAVNRGERFPRSILKIANDNHGSVHPTQKPVALMEYLIRTYTNEGETVLDNTMGSGTTGVACVNTGRRFIGIERDEEYMEIAKDRISLAIESKLPITECS